MSIQDMEDFRQQIHPRGQGRLELELVVAQIQACSINPFP